MHVDYERVFATLSNDKCFSGDKSFCVGEISVAAGFTVCPVWYLGAAVFLVENAQ